MPASESDFVALALVHLRPPSQNAAFIAQGGRERLHLGLVESGLVGPSHLESWV